MLLEELVARYPLLYHMAEAGSWPSIRRHGLLSASGALDLFEVRGAARRRLEAQQRPEKVALEHSALGRLTLRDQKPLPVNQLAKCLLDGLVPSDWYRLLNGKTYFWVSRQRLLTLLSARSYRAEEHDVLTVGTESLVRAHAQKVFLCHINSGNTFPFPQPRGIDTFKRIHEYRSRSGRPEKEVVELVVDYSVPDISRHVLRVDRMRRDKVRRIIWQRRSATTRSGT